MNTRLDDQIAQWKTRAWQTPQVFGIYQANIYADRFAVTLKNLREMAIAVGHAQGRVLDAGAGTGRFTIPLHDAGFDVTGLDVSEEMLTIARQAADSRPIPFLQGSIFDLPFAADSFDTVVSITVINHFPQWGEILREYARVLRPGGRLIFNLRSRPHVDYANRNGVRYGTPGHPGDPGHFMAEVEVAEIETVLATLGAKITHLYPYEAFNNNFVLQEALGDRYDTTIAGLQAAFREPGALELWEFIERDLFPYLPIVISYGLMVVAELDHSDHPVTPWQQPPMLREISADSLRATMGAAYEGFQANLARHLEADGAVRLLAALNDQVLSHLDVSVDFLSLLDAPMRARVLDQIAWRWTQDALGALTPGMQAQGNVAVPPSLEYEALRHVMRVLRPLAEDR